MTDDVPLSELMDRAARATDASLWLREEAKRVRADTQHLLSRYATEAHRLSLDTLIKSENAKRLRTSAEEADLRGDPAQHVSHDHQNGST